MLNKKEVAEKLQVTTRTVENWVNQGLPSYMVGRVRRFEEKEVINWFKDRSEKEKEMQITCALCEDYGICKNRNNPNCLKPTNGYE